MEKSKKQKAKNIKAKNIKARSTHHCRVELIETFAWDGYVREIQWKEGRDRSIDRRRNLGKERFNESENERELNHNWIADRNRPCFHFWGVFIVFFWKECTCFCVGITQSFLNNCSAFLLFCFICVQTSHEESSKGICSYTRVRNLMVYMCMYILYTHV